MPSGEASGLGVNVDGGLRERLPHQPEAPVKAANINAAQEAVKVLNEQQAKEEKDEKDKKTFGRTPDGTGAYNIPSPFNGCRVEHVWDSKVSRSRFKLRTSLSAVGQTVRTLKLDREHVYIQQQQAKQALVPPSSFQLTILMP